MSDYLYLKTDLFKSNKDMALYYANELKTFDIPVDKVVDLFYMYTFRAMIEGQTIHFYMGKNEQKCTPPLWQIWPEHKASLIKKLMGKIDPAPHNAARKLLEQITDQVPGASEVQWSN